jgi:hypothetical protein
MIYGKNKAKPPGLGLFDFFFRKGAEMPSRSTLYG